MGVCILYSISRASSLLLDSTFGVTVSVVIECTVYFPEGKAAEASLGEAHSLLLCGLFDHICSIQASYP